MCLVCTDSSVGPELSRTSTEDLWWGVKLNHHLQRERSADLSQAGSTTIEGSNTEKGSIKNLHNLLRLHTPPQTDSTVSTSSAEKLHHKGVFKHRCSRETCVCFCTPTPNAHVRLSRITAATSHTTPLCLHNS